MTRLHMLWRTFKRNLNFFRIHVLYFTFTPLIASAIFYAANGENRVSYIDSLYNCISAIVVCGLATIDLSGITAVQQAILFILQCIGSPVVVSWVMVYVRRRYFAKKFEHIIEAEIERRKALIEPGDRVPLRRSLTNWGRRLSTAFNPVAGPNLDTVLEEAAAASEKKRPEEKENADGNALWDASRVSSRDKKEKSHIFGGLFSRKSLKAHNVRTDMIRRVETAPQPVDPSGWVTTDPDSEDTAVSRGRYRDALPRIDEKAQLARDSASVDTDTRPNGDQTAPPQPILITEENRQTSDPEQMPLPRSPTITSGPGGRSGVPIPHTFTVEFRTPAQEYRDRHQSAFPAEAAQSMRSRSPAKSRRYSTAGASNAADVVHDDRHFVPGPGPGMPRRATTQHTNRTRRSVRPSAPQRAMTRGYGGFPYPQTLILRLIKKLFPSLEEKFVRTLTLPRTQTLGNVLAPITGMENQKDVRYISFRAIVGRNSKFHLLTEENLEELGGVEYRALTALLWIVGGYHLLIQLFSFTIIAPYISTARWHNVFEPPQLHRFVPPVWFSAFQTVSAYTNTGMSLVDQSMLPFQRAYPMIFVMAFLILAGNTAYPIFLRLTIWIISKVVPEKSRTNETLHFLLDHPRRCFIYLFPSHQTWFLLTVLLFLNGTDYFFFLVLDIGNAAVDSIPVGVRFAIGSLQAVAVRAAGFATVSLSSLAPAVQVLYVMMMYISVYPIAMSVRSTNVYEENSLGVYEEEEEEEEPSVEGTRVAVWGRYLAWHARRQLAFDMWWLGLALFLVCIIERSKLQDVNNFSWFTIFAVIFELISAYGNVGLSLGLPFANFSFSGALTPLSKLIVCAVMLRGRHRGLPVAIDRAVMLPKEFKKAMGLREEGDGTSRAAASNVDNPDDTDEDEDGENDSNSFSAVDDSINTGARTGAAVGAGLGHEGKGADTKSLRRSILEGANANGGEQGERRNGEDRVSFSDTISDREFVGSRPPRAPEENMKDVGYFYDEANVKERELRSGSRGSDGRGEDGDGYDTSARTSTTAHTNERIE